MKKAIIIALVMIVLSKSIRAPNSKVAYRSTTGTSGQNWTEWATKGDGVDGVSVGVGGVSVGVGGTSVGVGGISVAVGGISVGVGGIIVGVGVAGTGVGDGLVPSGRQVTLIIVAGRKHVEPLDSQIAKSSFVPTGCGKK